MPNDLRILCLNSGSSSLKFALYDLGEVEVRLAAGAVERIGMAGGRLWINDASNKAVSSKDGDFPDSQAAVHAVFETLSANRFPAPAAVGHRLVHGGPEHMAPERVDAHLITALRRLVPFAPLHLPAQIDGMAAVAARFPDIPQVVGFDTAFHRGTPELARRLPLRRALWDDGIRRYGFHGLSYEYIIATAGAATLGRAIIAHLGNGASMVAIRDGRPLDTSMGFTPAGGFMMGTRSGDLDPGVLLYLLTAKGYDAAALERLVNHEAGLLGVSGFSADMETLLERRAEDLCAAEAVEMFCYHVRKQIGALAAVLGGVDTLVFTGGIGEHAAVVRWEVCSGLAHLGIGLDAGQNDANAAVVSTPASPCTVRVIPTDEVLMIARHTRAVLAAEGPGVTRQP